MLRVAVHNDVPALVRLINAVFRVEEFFVSGDRTNAQDIEARLEAADAVFLVIDDHADGSRDSTEPGELAGAVYVDIRNGRGHFAMLAVNPDRRGLGLGRVLVEAAESFCRAAGCREVDIDVVNVREELPAFYTAFGYVPTGRAPFPEPAKLHRDAHMVVWSKSLVSP